MLERERHGWMDLGIIHPRRIASLESWLGDFKTNCVFGMIENGNGIGGTGSVRARWVCLNSVLLML